MKLIKAITKSYKAACRNYNWKLLSYTKSHLRTQTLAKKYRSCKYSQKPKSSPQGGCQP